MFKKRQQGISHNNNPNFTAFLPNRDVTVYSLCLMSPSNKYSVFMSVHSMCGCVSFMVGQPSLPFQTLGYDSISGGNKHKNEDPPSGTMPRNNMTYTYHHISFTIITTGKFIEHCVHFFLSLIH